MSFFSQLRFLAFLPILAACSGGDPGVGYGHSPAREAGAPTTTPAPSTTPGDTTAPPAPTTPPEDAGTDATTAPKAACVVCINAGGPAYTAANGRAYVADTDSDTGTAATSTNPVTKTDDMALFQTERYGTDFTYTLPAPNGSYALNLLFAEVYWTNPGERVFNVDVQGTRVLDNYDIVSDVGANVAVTKTYPVTVTDGTVKIAFSTVTDAAKISAIELIAK